MYNENKGVLLEGTAKKPLDDNGSRARENSGDRTDFGGSLSLSLDTLNSFSTPSGSSVGDLTEHAGMLADLTELTGDCDRGVLDDIKGQINPMDGLYSMQSSYFAV